MYSSVPFCVIAVVPPRETREVPQTITVNGPDRVFQEELKVPSQITGYEYQFVACRDSIEKGLLEPPQMPLEETLYIMELMDGLRAKWGVRYPMDDKDYSVI